MPSCAGDHLKVPPVPPGLQEFFTVSFSSSGLFTVPEWFPSLFFFSSQLSRCPPVLFYLQILQIQFIYLASFFKLAVAPGLELGWSPFTAKESVHLGIVCNRCKSPSCTNAYEFTPPFYFLKATADLVCCK